MQRHWWKGLSVVLLFYTIIAGFLISTPVLGEGGLYESIRNIFFHVPMWFNMTLLFLIACGYSIAYLRTFNPEYDIKAAEFTKIGLLFSILGMLTGMEWANFTWSDKTGRSGPWTGDPKQLCAALCMLIYFAYIILRDGIKDEEKRGRIAAVYHIFASALMIPLIFIIPRLVYSLHPGGSEGNPALNPDHLDPKMRLVFWPGVIGWFLLSLWITNIKLRIRLYQYNRDLAKTN